MGYGSESVCQRARQRFDQQSKPDYVGTPRGVLAYIAGLHRRLGSVHRAERFELAATGERVSLGGIRDLVTMADCERAGRGAR